MTDGDTPMFPRERKPARKAFPVFTVVCGLLLLALAGVFGPKLWLDRDERQAYAQAQVVGHAFLTSLKSDTDRFDDEYGDIGLQPPTRGMDFDWNRKQFDRLHALVERYRAVGAERRQKARDAMLALKIQGGLRRKYMAEIDRTLADKKALFEQRLNIIDSLITARRTQYDILSRRSGWRADYYGVIVNNNADFQALERQSEIVRKLLRDKETVTHSLLADELWVSPPP